IFPIRTISASSSTSSCICLNVVYSEVVRRRTALAGQAVAMGVGRRLDAVGGADLGEDVIDVTIDGVQADHQRRGDLRVGAAGGEQPQYLYLARAQSVRVGSAGR